MHSRHCCQLVRRVPTSDIASLALPVAAVLHTESSVAATVADIASHVPVQWRGMVLTSLGRRHRIT